MNFVLTDGDGFAAHAGSADLLVVEFSRREVERGVIGDALDRLLNLTDSREFVDRYEGRVLISFQGYDDCPLEVYEIPACRTFLATITREWPYWLHFAFVEEPLVNQVQLILAILAGATAFNSDSGAVALSFDDEPCLRLTADQLQRGLAGLYAMHALGDDRLHARRAAIAGYLPTIECGQ